MRVPLLVPSGLDCPAVRVGLVPPLQMAFRNHPEKSRPPPGIVFWFLVWMTRPVFRMFVVRFPMHASLATAELLTVVSDVWTVETVVRTNVRPRTFAPYAAVFARNVDAGTFPGETVRKS